MILLLSIFGVVSLIYAEGELQNIEAYSVENGITQAKYAIENEQGLMENTIRDWAWWDDLYWYAGGTNPDFIKNNVNPESMEALNVHLVVILNKSGSVLYERRFSPDGDGEGPVPARMLEIARSEMTGMAAGESGSGIVTLPDGPAIVAFTPILNSSAEGEPSGTLVMGRYLNFGLLSGISHIIGNPVEIYWKSGQSPDDEVNSLLSAPVTDKHTVIDQNGPISISGYTQLTDLSGKPVILGITVPRDIYNKGMRSLLILMLFFSIFGIIMVAVLLIVLDSSVLGRISLLTKQVGTLGLSEGKTPLPVLTGDDELTQLEQGILQKHSELLWSKDLLSTVVEGITSPVLLLSEDGTVLLANKVASEGLGIPHEDLIGSKISGILGKEALIDTEDLKNVVSSRNNILFRKRAAGRSYLVSAYPVRAQDNSIRQIVVFSVDTTERDRIETALTRALKKINVLDSFILNDLKNQNFVLDAYLSLITQSPDNVSPDDFYENMKGALEVMNRKLSFASEYRNMGASPPIWQDVDQAVLFAMSHVNTVYITKEISLKGFQIYADRMLEEVFRALFENAVSSRGPVNLIQSSFHIEGEDLVIIIEDDGNGVPISEKESIFELPHENFEEAGLFLAKEILSLTDILLRESGDPRKGGRFEIIIPGNAYRFTKLVS